MIMLNTFYIRSKQFHFKHIHPGTKYNIISFLNININYNITYYNTKVKYFCS